MRTAVTLTLALALGALALGALGCGRVGFDPVGGGADAATDGPGDGAPDGPGMPAQLRFVQGGDVTAPNAAALAIPLAILPQAQGNMNIVVIGVNDSLTTLLGVTDDQGNVYTRAIGTAVGALQQWTYYAVLAGGTNTVRVAFDRQAFLPSVMVAEYSGIATVDPIAAAVGAGATSDHSDSGPATISVPRALLVGANTNANPSVAGPGPGFTERLRNGYGDVLIDREVNAPGSYRADAPLTSVHPWVMQMVAFKPRTGL